MRQAESERLYQQAHELILFWDAKLFHSGSNSGTPWHLKKGLAHVLIGITGKDGTRSVCLFDDPVKDDPVLPDNPAHALLIATKDMLEEDIAEIRTRLVTESFGDLRHFAA